MDRTESLTRSASRVFRPNDWLHPNQWALCRLDAKSLLVKVKCGSKPFTAQVRLERDGFRRSRLRSPKSGWFSLNMLAGKDASMVRRSFEVIACRFRRPPRSQINKLVIPTLIAFL